MKILVISDSHGDVVAMQKIISLHRDAELLIFLGDGLRDLAAASDSLPATMATVSVCGNCDFLSIGSLSARDDEMLTVEGRRILITHGHKYGVKGGLGALAAAAHARGADIVLFGHTHEPHESLIEIEGRSIRLFNPGSVGRPHDRITHYGLLDIRENGVLFSAAALHD